jgi:hypothetical protein
MNANDLPPAAKLAALIEAGRAANPDLKHGRGQYLEVRYGTGACALGFALLATGMKREVLAFRSDDSITDDAFKTHLGMVFLSNNLLGQVADKNDFGLSLDEIILSLREGELAKVAA